MEKFEVKIIGTGSYLPGNPVPFDEVDTYLGDLTDASQKIKSWLKNLKSIMKEMVDIEYYHYAFSKDTGEYFDDNITMSYKASLEAIKKAGISESDIELIVYGSPHQDQMPTASVRIQKMLGIKRCAELSIHANCTSAYKALLLGYDLIRIGRYKNALVISSNISSSELKASYYNQKKVKKEELFLRYFLCDGASAVLLVRDEKKKNGIYIDACYMESLAGEKPSVMGNKRPAYWMNPKEEFEEARHHLFQLFQNELRKHFYDPDGSVFFKGLKRMIDLYNIDLSRIKFFQVNLPSKHIAELVMEECKKLGIKKESFYTKMSKVGYSGPPMMLICLDKILTEEKLFPGESILSFVTEVSNFMQAGYLISCY